MPTPTPPESQNNEQLPVPELAAAPPEPTVRCLAPPSHRRSMYRQLCRSFQTAKGKAWAVDAPPRGPDDDLATHLASASSSAKSISPLKADIAMLAQVVTDLRRQYHTDRSALRQDLLHLTTVVRSSTSASRTSEGDPPALQTLSHTLSLLATTVETNENQVATEFQGMDQRMDGVLESVESLRKSCSDTNVMLHQLCESLPSTSSSQPPRPPLATPPQSLVTPARPPPPSAFPPAPALPPPAPNPPPPAPMVTILHPSLNRATPAQQLLPLSDGFHSQPAGSALQASAPRPFSVPGPVLGPSYENPPLYGSGLNPISLAHTQPPGDPPPQPKRQRRDPPAVPTLSKPSQAPRPAFVSFGMVEWRDDLPENPLEEQVRCAVEHVWDADYSLFQAYQGSFIRPDPRFISMRFASSQHAARFVDLWYKTRMGTKAGKATAMVQP